ncbi:hypothetical protein [Chryseobacterium luteum]|nr:hypothetical protein [Chryseobacterium luteum]
MKYWQLQVCLANELNIFEKYIGEFDIIKRGQEIVPENIVLQALSDSKENLIILSNNYLRSSTTSDLFFKESNNKIIKTIKILEAYKRYGEIITEVFDYGSVELKQ